MQYIQFQPQLATDIPSAGNGYVNFYIDSDNNTVKIKTDSGSTVTVGGGGITTVSKSEIDDLISTESLVVGSFYNITNAGASDSNKDLSNIGSGTSIVVQAITTSKISTKGFGLFWNPKYDTYNVWDYHHRISFVNLTNDFQNNEYLYFDNGINSTYGYLEGTNGNNHMVIYFDDLSDTFLTDPNNLSGLTITGDYSGESCEFDGIDFISSYETDDKVIWGNKVWQSIDGVVSDSENEYELNPDHWSLVEYNNIDYNLVLNEIEYDYDNDNICYRSDGSNYVRQDWEIIGDWWNENKIKNFPWGHPDVKNVRFRNCYLEGVVNFHNTSEMVNVSVEKLGDFEFNNYCGRQLGIYDIEIDTWGYFYSNRFPYNNIIYGLKIGVFSEFTDNDFYDNDYGYTQVWDIELGLNARIYNTYLYKNSRFYNITIGNQSEMYNMEFKQGSRMFYCTIGGADARISNITLNNNAEIKYINLKDYSYINSGTLDVSSCLKRVEMGPECYINVFNIGVDSFIRQISMNSRSYIYNVTIGDYSNYQNIDFGSYSYMTNITIGDNTNFEDIDLSPSSYITNISTSDDCYFGKINLGPQSYIDSITLDYSSSMEVIDLKSDSFITYIHIFIDSYFSNISVSTNCEIGLIDLQDNSYISEMEVMNNSSFGEIVLYTGSSIYNIQLGQSSGFGGINLSTGITFNNFEIGQNMGFCCETFTENKFNVKISKGLSNFYPNPIVSGGTSYLSSPTELPYINTDQTIHVINISGVSNGPFMYYLEDGQYEGQELTMVLKGDGTFDNEYVNDPYNIQIYIENARTANGTIISNGSPIWFNWYPFAKENGGWRSVGKCIWVNGAWNTDNDQFD